ncbi:MAG: transcription termination factor Rho [Marmoricola sp.]|nr:transcription termination factor Rho [Marmoricola sp.]
MTETTETTATPDAKGGPKRAGGGLSGMLLPELKQVAGGLGIKATGMKKAELVAAIKTAQSGGSRGGQSGEKAGGQTRTPKRAEADSQDRAEVAESTERTERTEPAERTGRTDRAERVEREPRRDESTASETSDDAGEERRARNQNNGAAGRTQNQDGRASESNQNGQPNQNGQNGQAGTDDESGSRRNRRRRGRDRDRVPASNAGPQQSTGGNQSAPNHGNQGGRTNRNEPDLQILEDDVLAPCAGILDVLDSYAFVRTSGYLPGTDDVYVSLSTVRKYGLRRGDAIVGQVRQPREGDRKEKFNPLVKLDSVNGGDPEAAKTRVEFSKLTPLYPSERLRMETTSTNMIGRVIDIASPIGKGQRGLIVSPAKAGKTMIMQSIANSITTNNPECHLMVVLVDERPEEVTDFERSVNGEVISSTFDRPATDHTMVAELAIERAKRLVELGHDVVVLLDGITRLGRAYNLAAPASGRILSGGVDSAALYPPKKFFGAARNIEDGGSLTILATALIESGSKMDEVIFEEFKGTGNMEIRLRRDLADKRIFPAIDAVGSGTRREELLMSSEELAIIWKLRRVLSGLDGQQALELLLERLKKSQNNLEFLMQVQKTTPTAGTPEG